MTAELVDVRCEQLVDAVMAGDRAAFAAALAEVSTADVAAVRREALAWVAFEQRRASAWPE